MLVIADYIIWTQPLKRFIGPLSFSHICFVFVKHQSLAKGELVALLEQGSIFQRFYPGRFDPGWDVADSVAGGSSWQRAFATTDAKAVEAMCRKVTIT